MGGLKDQLLKAGLVNEKQVKKAQQEKRKENQQKTAPQKTAEALEEQARRQQAQAEKAERDRQLNLQRKEEADRKALIAQVRQLIETHRLPKAEWENPHSETPYNFQDSGMVKRLFVAEAVRGKIIKGIVAIVKLDRQYELIPAEIADKIRQRDATAILVQNTPAPNTASSTVDDPYAAYQIPDDLMW